MNEKMKASSGSVDDILEPSRKLFGFIPNILKEMSISPTLTKVYMKGQGLLTLGKLTAAQNQAVQLYLAWYFGCEYCQAGHQFLAERANVPVGDLKRIRNGELPSNPALSSVIQATDLMLKSEGKMTPEQRELLEELGVTRELLFEIIGLIGLKTITAYMNRISQTKVDPEFQSNLSLTVSIPRN